MLSHVFLNQIQTKHINRVCPLSEVMVAGTSHDLAAAPLFCWTSRPTLRTALNLGPATSCDFFDRSTNLIVTTYANLPSGGRRFCKSTMSRWRRCFRGHTQNLSIEFRYCWQASLGETPMYAFGVGLPTHPWLLQSGLR